MARDWALDELDWGERVLYQTRLVSQKNIKDHPVWGREPSYLEGDCIVTPKRILVKRAWVPADFDDPYIGKSKHDTYVGKSKRGASDLFECRIEHLGGIVEAVSETGEDYVHIIEKRGPGRPFQLLCSSPEQAKQLQQVICLARDHYAADD